MPGDLKPIAWQFDRPYLFLMIDQHIINTIAVFANKMLMLFDQRIEMLRATPHQDLQLLVRKRVFADSDKLFRG
jgi:hypothetical protein